jgi:hypothetical protein
VSKTTKQWLKLHSILLFSHFASLPDFGAIEFNLAQAQDHYSKLCTLELKIVQREKVKVCVLTQTLKIKI